MSGNATPFADVFMTHRSISPKFKHEAASLAIQQNYIVKQTCQVSISIQLFPLTGIQKFPLDQPAFA